MREGPPPHPARACAAYNEWTQALAGCEGFVVSDGWRRTSFQGRYSTPRGGDGDVCVN